MKVPTNRVEDVFKHYSAKLASHYTQAEGKSMMHLLFMHLFGLDKIELIKNRDQRLSESEMLKIHFAVGELLTNKPIQYVIGETDFMGMTFQVNTDVLIPRPETEELVNLILEREPDKASKRLLDIGTGSGCIAIALKNKCPELDVYGLDVSVRALAVANQNAMGNQADVEFIQADILSEKTWPEMGNFDIIVSNPPYVTESDKKFMHKNVLDFEPMIALFVADSDALLFYRKIAAFGNRFLSKTGVVYFEINEAFGNKIKELLIIMGYNSIEIIKDFQGKERFVRALI